MSESLAQRWTFLQPSPLGDFSWSWELSHEGVRFSSDAPMAPPSELLRWDAVTQACTAGLDRRERRTGPERPHWMPERMEWLLVSRSDQRGAFMRPLPSSDARDAIVAALRERLGSRWVGERLPLASARRTFHVPEHGGTLNVWGIVLTALLILVVLLVVFAVATSLLALPAMFAAGALTFHRGLKGLRDALQAANTPTGKVTSAAMGLVELQGCACTDAPSPAGVSGCLSVWWDVTIEAWDSDGKDSGWRPLLSRHGGSSALVLEDATGRVPVWLRDADLMLQEHTWESGQDALPASGMALLESTRHTWAGQRRLRVRETRMEVGGTLYVLGTLDEARRALVDGRQGGRLSRWARTLRTGQWRSAAVQWVPGFLRMPVAVVIGYLDIVSTAGRRGGRARRLDDAPAPEVAGDGLLVWKGRARRAFIVSDRREADALKQLRARSLWLIGGGVAVLSMSLHQIIRLF
jgi:hypothetical protein